MDLTHCIKYILAAAMAIACRLPMYASDQESPKIVSGLVNLNDSAAVYKALYDNTPIEPVFKLAPRFAIVGFDNRFVFSIGANYKFTSSFDWNNPVHNPVGLSLGGLEPLKMRDRHLYQMTAGGSSIYFNIIGFPNTDNETGLFISLGVDSEHNNTYKIAATQVYMRYKGLQLGYATSLYNDRGADAYTIDGAGPCASGSHSTVGMNWQHFFNRHMRMGIGAELPNASYTQIVPALNGVVQSALVKSAASNQYVPNFPLYVSYVWGANHVRLSGLVRNIHYVDLLTGESHHQMGYGVKLTGHLVTGPLEWYWMGQYGYASASTFVGDNGSGLDLVPDDKELGKLIPAKTWGLIAAAQWNVTPKHILTLQYSRIHHSLLFSRSRNRL